MSQQNKSTKYEKHGKYWSYWELGELLFPFYQINKDGKAVSEEKILCRTFSTYFCVHPTKVVYTEAPQSWDTRNTSKSMNRVGSISFARNLHFSIFVQRVQYLKTLFDHASNSSSCSQLNLITESRTRVHNIRCLLPAKDISFRKTKIWRQTVQTKIFKTCLAIDY